MYKRQELRKRFQIYETDILTYRTVPDRFPVGPDGRTPAPCSMQTASEHWDFMLAFEAFPAVRGQFGALEISLPANPAGIMDRAWGNAWRHMLQRTLHSHLALPNPAQAAAAEAEAKAAGRPPPFVPTADRPHPRVPGHRCQVDAFAMDPRELRFVMRPALPLELPTTAAAHPTAPAATAAPPAPDPATSSVLAASNTAAQ